MSRLCLFLALFTITARAQASLQNCHDSMIARTVLTGEDSLSLKNLAEQLPANQKAAVLFKIDLTGFKPTLPALIELTESADDLDIPSALRLFNEGSLLFVAQGTHEGLVKLLKRIWDLKIVKQTSVYSLSASAASPVLTPKELVQSEEDFLQARLQQRTFAVFLQNQVSFMVPSEQIENLSGIIAKEKINVYRVRRPPVSWTAWISRKTDDLRQKTVVFAGDWALVSHEAFGILQEAASSLQSGLSDEATSLNRRILAQLEHPAPPSGGRAQRAEPEEDRWTPACRKLIVAYLREHRPRTALKDAEGVERAFLALAKLIPNERSAGIYRKLIREIGFGRWDYQALTRNDEKPVERFIQGWRAYLTATKNPYADLPVNLRNVKEAIKQLPQ